MSTRPIWNPLTKRSELGGARKITIYAVKAATGAAIALGLWAAGCRGDVIMTACVSVFVTSKVCWYLNTRTRPTGLDDYADWVTDGVLHFAWWGGWQWMHGNHRVPPLLVALLLATYAWSCE